SAKGLGLGYHSFQAGGKAVIRLQPEQAIHGRLIDLQGQPAAGVELRVCRLGKRNSGAAGGVLFRPVRAINLAISADGKRMAGMGMAGNEESPVGRFRDPPANLPLWPKSVTTDG